MIFQYTRVVSSQDSKRHYRWECVSRDYEHVFQFLSPNGNRYEVILFNDLQSTTRKHDQVSSFIDELTPQDLTIYHKIIEEYPMIPCIKLSQTRAIPYRYDHIFPNRNSTHITDIKLFACICECQINIMEIEYELLKLDAEQKLKQQQFALYNELTNVLSKTDTTSFLSHCLQSLKVTDEKDMKMDGKETPTPKQQWSPNVETAPLTLRDDLRRTVKRNIPMDCNCIGKTKRSKLQS